MCMGKCWRRKCGDNSLKMRLPAEARIRWMIEDEENGGRMENEKFGEDQWEVFVAAFGG